MYKIFHCILKITIFFKTGDWPVKEGKGEILGYLAWKYIEMKSKREDDVQRILFKYWGLII